MDSPNLTGKTQCPDCDHCQMCSRSRCRACLKGEHAGKYPELGTSFTHGDYLRWKGERDRVRIEIGHSSPDYETVRKGEESEAAPEG